MRRHALPASPPRHPAQIAEGQHAAALDRLAHGGEQVRLQKGAGAGAHREPLRNGERLEVGLQAAAAFRRQQGAQLRREVPEQRRPFVLSGSREVGGGGLQLHQFVR